MSFSGMQRLDSQHHTVSSTSLASLDFQFIDIDTVDNPTDPVFPFEIDGLWKLENITVVQLNNTVVYRYILRKFDQCIYMEKVQDDYYFFFSKFECPIDSLHIPPPKLMDIGTQEEFQSIISQPNHNTGLPMLINSSECTHWLYKSTTRNVFLTVTAFETDVTIAMGRCIPPTHFKML